MYREVNEEAYREQIETESNSFVWLSEVLSSHPRLPKRIQALQQFEKSGARVYAPDHRKIALGTTLLFGSLVAVYFFSSVIFAGGTFVYSQFMPTSWEDSLFEEDFLVEEQTSLMSAASNGDLAAVEQAVAEGQDILGKDAEGTDALMYAVYAAEAEVVSYLLANGADANTSDDYSTALGTAVMYEEYKIALLLMENGADPYLADTGGMTAMDYMNAPSKAEFLALLEAGND